MSHRPNKPGSAAAKYKKLFENTNIKGNLISIPKHSQPDNGTKQTISSMNSISVTANISSLNSITNESIGQPQESSASELQPPTLVSEDTPSPTTTNSQPEKDTTDKPIITNSKPTIQSNLYSNNDKNIIHSKNASLLSIKLAINCDNLSSDSSPSQESIEFLGHHSPKKLSNNEAYSYLNDAKQKANTMNPEIVKNRKFWNENQIQQQSLTSPNQEIFNSTFQNHINMQTSNKLFKKSKIPKTSQSHRSYNNTNSNNHHQTKSHPIIQGPSFIELDINYGSIKNNNSGSNNNTKPLLSSPSKSRSLKINTDEIVKEPNSPASPISDTGHNTVHENPSETLVALNNIKEKNKLKRKVLRNIGLKVETQFGNNNGSEESCNSPNSENSNKSRSNSLNSISQSERNRIPVMSTFLRKPQYVEDIAVAKEIEDLNNSHNNVFNEEFESENENKEGYDDEDEEVDDEDIDDDDDDDDEDDNEDDNDALTSLSGDNNINNYENNAIDTTNDNDRHESLLSRIDSDYDVNSMFLMRGMVFNKKVDYMRKRIVDLEKEIKKIPNQHRWMCRLMLSASLEYLGVNPEEKALHDKIDFWDYSKYQFKHNEEMKVEQNELTNNFLDSKWDELGINLSKDINDTPIIKDITILDEIYYELKDDEKFNPISLKYENYENIDDSDVDNGNKQTKKIEHLINGNKFLKYLFGQISKEYIKEQKGLAKYVNMGVEDTCSEMTKDKLRSIFEISVYYRIKNKKIKLCKILKHENKKLKSKIESQKSVILNLKKKIENYQSTHKQIKGNYENKLKKYKNIIMGLENEKSNHFHNYKQNNNSLSPNALILPNSTRTTMGDSNSNQYFFKSNNSVTSNNKQTNSQTKTFYPGGYSRSVNVRGPKRNEINNTINNNHNKSNNQLWFDHHTSYINHHHQINQPSNINIHHNYGSHYNYPIRKNQPTKYFLVRADDSPYSKTGSSMHSIHSRSRSKTNKGNINNNNNNDLELIPPSTPVESNTNHYIGKNMIMNESFQDAIDTSDIGSESIHSYTDIYISDTNESNSKNRKYSKQTQENVKMVTRLVAWKQYINREEYISQRYPKECENRNKAWEKWTIMLDEADKTGFIDDSNANKIWKYIDFARMSLGRYSNWIWFPINIKNNKHLKELLTNMDKDKEYYDKQSNTLWKKKYGVVMDFNLFFFNKEFEPNNIQDTLTQNHLVLSLSQLKRICGSKRIKNEFYLYTGTKENKIIKFRCNSQSERKEWCDELDYQTQITKDLLKIPCIKLKQTDHSSNLFLPGLNENDSK